ncbi:MAG: glycosyltransferase 4 family protein [Candidatus Aenigmatarchaeota archaeon]
MLEILVLVAAFIVTYLVTPIFIKKLTKAGITASDIHKPNKPKVPEMGGLAILFGFSAGVLLATPFLTTGLISVFAVLSSILLLGLIGICDDIFGIRQKTKMFLPVFAAIPLMVIQAGIHTMNLPLVGLVNFGIIYPLILIPLGITVVSNSFNMLAGYNGIEAGTGFIACGFVGLLGFLSGNMGVTVLMFSMAGACLAFLMFNKYPAKIFPGDVGTFAIGAALAGTVIIGNIEGVGAIIILPHIINGIITTVDILRGKPIQKFAEVKNGILVPPEKKYVQTLYFYLERMFKLSEPKLVQLVWTLTLITGLLALLFVYI